MRPIWQPHGSVLQLEPQPLLLPLELQQFVLPVLQQLLLEPEQLPPPVLQQLDAFSSPGRKPTAPMPPIVPPKCPPSPPPVQCRSPVA
jgi:hypothetical protein